MHYDGNNKELENYINVIAKREIKLGIEWATSPKDLRNDMRKTALERSESYLLSVAGKLAMYDQAWINQNYQQIIVVIDQIQGLRRPPIFLRSQPSPALEELRGNLMRREANLDIHFLEIAKWATLGAGGFGGVFALIAAGASYAATSHVSVPATAIAGGSAAFTGLLTGAAIGQFDSPRP